MILGRDIVCVASNWSESPTGKHHIMRRLARENRVLWINYHASRRPRLNIADLRHAWGRLREIGRSPRGAPTETNANQLHAVTPLLLPWPESRMARALNGTRLRALVRGHVRPDRPCQLWLFTPDAPEIISAAPWERVVYCCVDEFTAFSGVNAELVASLERRTLAGTDVVLATSPPLFESRRQRHANVHLVNHGVDFEHFARASEPRPEHLAKDVSGPADIRHVAGPILGYFGLIADYVDVDLLADVARARPDWSLVLIGDVRTDVSRLAALPNVHLLGRRPYADLPEYCARFSIGLIPFRPGPLTDAVNPIKLREYLAAGLPVISARMPAVEGYQPAVRFAEKPADVIAAAENFLEQPKTPEMRLIREGVRREGWDARVEEISKLVMAATRRSALAPATHNAPALSV